MEEIVSGRELRIRSVDYELVETNLPPNPPPNPPPNSRPDPAAVM
jgi:hypothetical protein